MSIKTRSHIKPLIPSLFAVALAVLFTASARPVAAQGTIRVRTTHAAYRLNTLVGLPTVPVRVVPTRVGLVPPFGAIRVRTYSGFARPRRVVIRNGAVRRAWYYQDVYRIGSPAAVWVPGGYAPYPIYWR